jgi:hypothetical protein
MLKLKGDINYQYYQTSGVKTLRIEARCGIWKGNETIR